MKENLYKKGLIIGIIILFFGASVTQSISTESRTIIYVDDDNTEGPWYGTMEYPYQYIQDGIDAANPGDTIYVYNGIYYENVIVGKTLDLVGENRENVIVDGGGCEKVVYITIDEVSITNFTIRNGEYGLYLSSSLNSISNCESYGNTRYGIYFASSSNNNIVNSDSHDNTNPGSPSSGMGFWIKDSSSYNTFTGCNAYNNSGMYGGITCVHSSSYNSFVDCTSYNNSGSLGGYGIRFDLSPHNSVMNSVFYGNIMNICIIQSGYADVTNCTSYNTNSIGIFVSHTSHYTTITNCSSYNNRAGILIWASSNSKVIDCIAYDNDEYGISIQGNWLGPANYNNITNCDAYNNGEYGFYLYDDKDFGCSYNNINDCNSYNNNKYGFLLEKAAFNILKSNTIDNNPYNLGVLSDEWEETVIADFNQDISSSNTINNKPIYYLIEESDLAFDETDNFGFLGLVSCTNITVKNSDVYGILLADTTDATISNVTSHNSRSGIYSYSSSGNITNCDIYDNAEGGIYLIDTGPHNIKNCNVYENSGFWIGGIYLLFSPNINIIDCDLYDNEEGIVLATDSSNCNITNCNLYNNYDCGIYGWELSDLTVIDCDLHNNLWGGIYLWEIINSEFTYCNIYNNDIGFYIEAGADDNLIHHNNFVNNIENAYDECSNQWDDGSEGNYWSDYTGVDGDGDGIGDTPYNITGGSNQDRYPLMGPVPDLISPANNSSIGDQTPTFDWTDAWHSWTYTLHVATDPGFADPSIVINQTGLVESEYTPLGDLPLDTYYWRVRTTFLGIIMEWSETWSFFITLDSIPPTTPDLIEPADQSTLIITPTIFFDWTDSYDECGIDYYTLQIATDVNFVDIVSDVTSDDSDYTLTLTTPDEYYWRVQAVDNSGLPSSWSDVWMFTRLQDTNPPVVELLYPVGGEYLSGEVTILWDATDDITPDVDLPITIEYKFGDSWQILASDEENDGSYLWDTTGFQDGTIYKIRISTEDFWGNIGSDESQTTFTVDNTAPETMVYLDPATPDGEDNWYINNVQITFVATDETSGVDYTMYKIDDGDWQEYFVPFTVSEDGEHTVEFYSVDNAGNEEAIGEVSFKIDKTVPTIEFTWDEENSKLVADVDDETSGVAKVEFYVNDELIGEVTSPPYEMEYDASNGDTAYAIVYDNAGNSAESEIIESFSNNMQQSQGNLFLKVLRQRYI